MSGMEYHHPIIRKKIVTHNLEIKQQELPEKTFCENIKYIYMMSIYAYIVAQGYIYTLFYLIFNFQLFFIVK